MAKISSKKYKWILQNLLDTKGVDHSVYTATNESSTFDIKTMFGNEAIDYILETQKFSFTQKRDHIQFLLDEIKDSEDPEEIINAFEKHRVSLFKKDMKELRTNNQFFERREALIERLEVKIDASLDKWRNLVRKADEINSQEGIWPLFITTGFVTLKSNKREIYAPLLVKAITLEVKEDHVSIKSEDEWKINEKTLFIIKNSSNIKLPDEIARFKSMGAKEAVEKLCQLYKLGQPEFHKPFDNIPKDKIKSSSLTLKPGFVLGVFRPFGSQVRNAMLDIINNGELEKIISIKEDVEKSNTKVMDYILESSEDIVRIQETNFAQAKTIVSAILGIDSIIWGPPGTGKSQVISNIIANAMYNEKTAVVMSQKRSALDVLRKRLGSLSKFALFAINSKQLEKDEFYDNLDLFIESVSTRVPVVEREKIPMISDEEMKKIKMVNEAKDSDIGFVSAIKLVAEISNWKEKGAQFNEKLGLLMHMSSNFKYPKYIESFQEYKDEFMVVNETKYRINEKSSHFQKLEKIVSKKSHEFLGKFGKPKNLEQLIQFGTLTNIKIVRDVMKLHEHHANDGINNYSYANDIKSIESTVINRVHDMIANWVSKEKDKYALYENFLYDVKAREELPHNFIVKHKKVMDMLFPIVITTPDTAYVEWKKNVYDYSIVDESSQIPVEIGLPILYLGKTKILAGDPQQMQPSKWFTIRADLEDKNRFKRNKLINKKGAIKDNESLLDFALERNVPKTMLDKNYRSEKSALMSFSSKHFYESKLDVIDANNLVDKKAIDVYNVEGTWDSGRNYPEAEKIIQILKSEYKNYKSIIVLSFNSIQNIIIQNMINSEPSGPFKKAMQQKVIFKNLENIQGDEADLVIVSIGYTPDTNMASTYVSHAGGKNALNVALSRAKQKMKVVKSITDETVKVAKTEDFEIFKEWLEFLDLPENEKRLYTRHPSAKDINTDLGENVEKGMEEIAKSIPGVDIYKNYEIGSQKLEFAFVDKKTNEFLVGIKVDDFNYERISFLEEYVASVDNNSFLEAKGYNLYYLNELSWRLDKKTQKARITKDIKANITVKKKLSAKIKKAKTKK